MKDLMKLFGYVLISAMLFTACSSDKDDNKTSVNEEIEGVYALNYGSFGKGGASVTRYNFKKEEVTANYFHKQNNIKLASNIQYGALYNDNIYLMGNEADEVITLDKYFKPLKNAASKDINKPRFFVGEGKYLYISCLGENPDWKDMEGSYIAIFNTETNSVEKNIAMPGGPEGLAIVNGKLYVALNYATKIAVIDLKSQEISYIETPAVSSYFVKDNSNNLYATFVSTHNHPSAEEGLGYINTTTNELEKVYKLEGISSSYSSIVAANKDVSTIYVVAASWVPDEDGKWEQKGSVYSFDVNKKEFTTFAENLTGTNGVVSNPTNNDVYLLTAGSTSENGKLQIYKEDGTFVKDVEAGISPYWTIFLN